jgi:hypothetical protein
MRKTVQQLMARCLDRADRADRVDRQDSLHPGREVLPQVSRGRSTKNTAVLPQDKARPVKPDLREPEYRNRRERETLETLRRAGGPKHQDRKEVLAGINTRARDKFPSWPHRIIRPLGKDARGSKLTILNYLLWAAAENGLREIA